MPRLLGNISEWQWTHDPKLDSTRYTYAYSYDPLGRMTGATLFENKSRTDRFTEKGITYDLNGNIRSLNRYADQKLADSLKFDYIGNKINTLTKNARTTGSLNTGSKETIKLDAVDKSGLINSLKPNLDISSILHPKYSYDPSGNMTFDQRTGYTISYDCLGFIKKVERTNTTLANYTYLADGTLVAVEDQNKNGYVYIGSLVYAKRGDDLTLESTACDMGRIRKTEAGYQTEYFLTDHLGSPRAIINARKDLIAQNDFYPYGGRWEAPQIPTNDGRYLFNGKEKQVTGGIGWINYGARMYDPVIGRWTQPDPMEQLYRQIGAYVYCVGDPVRFIDPDGRKPRVYTQTKGIGHAFLTVGEGKNTVVYTYGRYGALYNSNALGRFTPTGEGVLIKKEGADAAKHLAIVAQEGEFAIHEIENANEAKIARYYDMQLEAGLRPSDQNKETYYDLNAKVVDNYSLFNNNCVTKTRNGINAGYNILDDSSMTPKAFQEKLDEKSQVENTIIRIDNSQDFVKNLIQQFKKDDN